MRMYYMPKYITTRNTLNERHPHRTMQFKLQRADIIAADEIQPYVNFVCIQSDLTNTQSTGPHFPLISNLRSL